MDENVPFAITEGLRKRGADVLSVQEDGYSGCDDQTIFLRANELGRVLFSRDSDLIIEAVHALEQGVSFTGVIYARQNGLATGQCIADLEVIALIGEPADFANQIRYLPL